MSLPEIMDTPGYFYAIGYALCASILVSLHRPRGFSAKRVLYHGLMVGLLALFMSVTRGAQGAAFIACIAAILADLYLSIYYVFRDGWITGFYTVKAFIFGEFAASLCWQVYYALALRFEWLAAWYGVAAVLAPTFAAIGLCLALVERPLCRHEAALEIGGRELATVLAAGLAVFVVSNVGYLDRGGIYSGSYARDVFMIRTLVDFSGVLLICGYHLQLIQLRLRYERDSLNALREMQYQSYRLSRESIELVNRKYHDLKHQITLLEARADSERARADLRQMRREIQAYEDQNRTGCEVLDAILTAKALRCRRQGIELKVIADGALLSFMEDMELSALFGNMLDNAIEAAERQADPERRLIRLYVDGEKGFLRIRIENYCDEKLRFVNGLPLTTRRDRDYHGFGMKSMQRTVNKYGGSMVAAQEDNRFRLRILIPMDGKG